MKPRREIEFTTTRSHNGLTAGKTCYQGHLQHNAVLPEKETRQRCSAKISRDGEGIILNADFAGLAELGDGAVKSSAIDPEILRQLAILELYRADKPILLAPPKEKKHAVANLITTEEHEFPPGVKALCASCRVKIGKKTRTRPILHHVANGRNIQKQNFTRLLRNQHPRIGLRNKHRKRRTKRPPSIQALNKMTRIFSQSAFMNNYNARNNDHHRYRRRTFVQDHLSRVKRARMSLRIRENRLDFIICATGKQGKALHRWQYVSFAYFHRLHPQFWRICDNRIFASAARYRFHAAK